MYLNSIVFHYIQAITDNWCFIYKKCNKTNYKTQEFTLSQPALSPYFEKLETFINTKKEFFQNHPRCSQQSCSYKFSLFRSIRQTHTLSYTHSHTRTHSHTFTHTHLHTIHNLSPSHYLSIYLTPTHTHNYPIFWPYLMHTSTHALSLTHTHAHGLHTRNTLALSNTHSLLLFLSQTL